MSWFLFVRGEEHKLSFSFSCPFTLVKFDYRSENGMKRGIGQTSIPVISE